VPIELVLGLVFVAPVVLGSILIALGLRLKKRDNDINSYGIVLGIGAAIILGWLGVLALLLMPRSMQ
jgi:hypothetical protein